MDFTIIIKIGVVGILTAIINMVLKKVDKEEIATLTTIAALVIVLLMVVDMLNSLFSIVRNLFFLY